MSRGHPPGTGKHFFRDLYVNLLETAGPALGRLLGGFSEAEALPSVFHCTGGKDRAGLSAALLLELLGVDRRTVLDDYELTATFRRREHQTDSFDNLVASGFGPEAAAGVLGAPRWAMAEALDTLDSRYGGAERYLVHEGGMHRDTIARLREMLIER